MDNNEDPVEFCLCGAELNSFTDRERGFCSKDCEQEYDAMMTESWNEIFLLLAEPQGSA